MSGGTALMVVTTDLVRGKIAKAIGETGVIARVKELAFGIGGVDENNQPIAPSTSNNSLVNEVFRIPVGSVTYPMGTTVEFEVTLDRPDQNGYELSEFGIVDEDCAYYCCRCWLGLFAAETHCRKTDKKSK